MEVASFLGGVILTLLTVGALYLIIRDNNTYLHQEQWYGGIVYSTKNSVRIHGLSGTRIIDGKWIAWIKSVWRTREGRHFILYVDELSSMKITPVSKEEAMEFIRLHAEKYHSIKLLRDWFKVEILTFERGNYHDRKS